MKRFGDGGRGREGKKGEGERRERDEEGIVTAEATTQAIGLHSERLRAGL